MNAGADAVIFDLEDAVAAPDKLRARDHLEREITRSLAGTALFVRINAQGTEWHAADLQAVARLAIDGVILPKAETGETVDDMRTTLGPDKAVIALVETARGIAALEEIAPVADCLAFGSVDFAADLGCGHTREALLFARSRIVMASRLAGKRAPIDGVTLAIKDPDAVEEDARYGAMLGFGGKLLIHPAQIEPAKRGLAPSHDDFIWASKILEKAGDGSARAVDGAMVDAPVLERARQIVRTRIRLLGGTTS